MGLKSGVYRGLVRMCLIYVMHIEFADFDWR